MSITRISIPVLTGGVSRQAENLRFPGQVEEADNCTIDQVRGLEKRSGTKYRFKPVAISSSPNTVHWVERSATEKYMMLFNPGQGDASIEIWNIVSGTKATVEWPTDAAIKTAIQSYMDAGSGNNDIKAVTVADTTLVWNTEVITEVTGTGSAYDPVLVDYTVTSTNDPRYIVDFADFPQPPDDFQEFGQADIPALPYYMRALQSFPGYPAGYYKTSDTSDQTDQPWFTRQVTPIDDSQMKQDTLPFSLKSTTINTFTVEWNTWKSRYSGDSDTNPPPSFIGKPISEITFFRNRLWLAADEQLVASQTGDIFNFWVNDPAGMVASDPIDVQMSTNRVANIQYLSPFGRSLVVFTSGDQQFEIRSNGSLSPEDIQILPSTAYESCTARPLPSGRQLYFPTERSGASQLYEYLYGDDSTPSTADDVAGHCYGYIPSGVNQMTHSEAASMIFLHSPNEQKNLYVHTYSFAGEDEKTQASWAKWIFDDNLVAFTEMDQVLYLLINRSGVLVMESMSLLNPVLNVNDDNMDYPIRLDGREILTGVYSSSTDTTSWPTVSGSTKMTDVILDSSWGTRAGERLIVDLVLGVPTIPGNWSAHSCIVGRKIPFRVRLSQQFVRDEKGAIAVGTLQLRKLTVFHRNTAYYAVEITPQGRTTRSLPFTAKRIGSLDLLLNRNVLSPTDSAHFPIMASSAGVRIDITSDNPSPLNITGAEVVGSFVNHKRSVTER
jgi:hypothetical protein